MSAKQQLEQFLENLAFDEGNNTLNNNIEFTELPKTPLATSA